MFSGASSFAERLRAAAQAGVEQFDHAARTHAPDLQQLHLPPIPKINLPTLPGGVTSPGGVGGGGVAGSPRRSGELERTSSTGGTGTGSALSSRLNSLVAGAGKARSSTSSASSNDSSQGSAQPAAGTKKAQGKGREGGLATASSRISNDSQTTAEVPPPRAGIIPSAIIDPTMVPLPPSPELEPFVITTDGTTTPDLGTNSTATPVFTRSNTPGQGVTIATVSADSAADDGHHASSSEATKIKSTSNLSLFNTPRNPLASSSSTATSPATAITIQRTVSPPPSSSPSAPLPPPSSPSTQIASDHVEEASPVDRRDQKQEETEAKLENAGQQQEREREVVEVEDPTVVGKGDGGADDDKTQERQKVGMESREDEQGSKNGKSYANELSKKLPNPPATTTNGLSILRTANDPIAITNANAARASQILREASPLLNAGIDDPDALEGWVKMVVGKIKVGDEEMKRLSGKLALQESRIEELRETHRLESESSSDLVGNLRDQLAKAETTLSTQATQLHQLASTQAELQTAQARVREEEEKRGKAVALLKTVRGKLVKLEREREQVEKKQEEEYGERQRLVAEVERLKAERETVKVMQEKEVAAVKERYEKEMLAKRREWELEMITTKVCLAFAAMQRTVSRLTPWRSVQATHAKDMAAKSKHINSLVESMQELNNAKRQQYEQLQARQEELETAVADKEMHEARERELALQAQEALERAQIAEEAVEDLQIQLEAAAGGRHTINNSNSGGNGDNDYPQMIPAQEMSRLLSDATAKSESKLAELRDQIAKLERERTESEEEQARQLRLRAQEVERLRTIVAERQADYIQAVKARESADGKVNEMQEQIKELRVEVEGLKDELRESQAAQRQIGSGDDDLKQELELLRDQIAGLNVQLEEARQAHAQLRSTNRTLREEMRRIQSSAQLLERQRNPGLGYWSASNTAGPSAAGHSPSSHTGTPGRVTTPLMMTGGQNTPAMSLRESVDASRSEAGTPTGVPTPAPGTASPMSKPQQEEEEVNLEVRLAFISELWTT
ncbi:hypothetical protein QFC22_004089 [Naganishia vaughanmartiniae]|uniref:Uncharacterized protein n=1 Tax=Naganishia vaughanmartiniae TaxID=1424756 RepID=A0ACC2X472_9TREE|nr:hypothetical protein QFC22_004089 [Naganishia vaughanmartiniae]